MQCRRTWTRPHVKVGVRYRMEEGEIEVDSIQPIGLPDVTPALTCELGFLGVADDLDIPFFLPVLQRPLIV